MATPGATLLNIGSGSGQNHFNLGVARTGDSSITTKTQAQLATYDEAPYFTTNETGTAVKFAVRLDAVTTSGSSYPRSEARELNPDGSLMSFTGTTEDHWMEGRSRISALAAYKRAMVIAQVHDADSDKIMIASQNVEPTAEWHVGGDTKIVIRINGTGTGIPVPIPRYYLDDEIAWRIRLGSIGWQVFINDFTTPFVKSTDAGMPALSLVGGCYFKAGCYSNTNASVEAGGGGSPASTYVSTELRALRHWHTGWPTPPHLVFGTDSPGARATGLLVAAA